MARPFRFQVSTAAVTNGRGWAELARKAEDLGYSSLAVADHLGDQLSPLPALAAAAAATERLLVTPLVLGVDYRNPAMLAQELATLDLVADGRLEIGMGAGWRTADYEQAGLSLDRPGVRIERLAEALTIVTGALAGSPFSFRGEHYTVRDLVAGPSPTQVPPVLVAGGGRRILSLAAREANIVGVNINLAAGVIDGRAGPNATDAATREKLDWIREAAGDRFDQLELHVRTQVAMVHDRPGEVAEMLAPALGISPADALDSPHALVGSIDAIVDTLLERREKYGFSYICWHDDAIDTLAPVVARLAGT